MKRYLIDTNVILRFITGEPKAQAERAKALMAQGESGACGIWIPTLVVAEVVFVLTGKVYGFSRAEVADALLQFLQTPALDVENRDVVIDALHRFKAYAIDYVDAYLAAEAASGASGIATFDGDFRKFRELELLRL